MNKERLIHLRIKVKSLVAEAQIIRQEANKTNGWVKWGLKQHNKDIVRRHTRHNLLAYGCLKGIPYKTMEKKCETSPNFKKVQEIARRFGGTSEEVTAWIEEAKVWIKG